MAGTTCSRVHAKPAWPEPEAGQWCSMSAYGTQRTFNATAKYVRSEGLAGNGVAALPPRRGQHWSKLLYARMVNSLALRRRMVPIVAG
jgi:hypothetical protein